MAKNTNNQTFQSEALAVARVKVAEAVAGSYGAMRDYSKVLNDTFAFDWFDIEHTDTSDEAKVLKVEKTAFYGELKSRMHTNPSVVWGRVREFGRVERHGEPVKSEGEQVEGEQGESGSENANRSPKLRNLEELTTLYKFNMRQDDLADDVAECNKFIIKALEALGVAINMVKTD
jgi:hypothetical protein